MAGWVSKIFEIIKSPKLVLWIFLVASALVFFPDKWLDSLKLQPFAQKYQLYLGIIWLASFSLLIIESVMALWGVIWRRWKAKKRKKQVSAAMQALDIHEKALLREFILKDKNTLNLPIQEPVVSGLLSKEVLVPVPGGAGDSYVTTGVLVPITISKDAKDLLSPPLLDLPEVPQGEKPTQQQIDWIKNSRPAFMKRIDDIDQLRHGQW